MLCMCGSMCGWSWYNQMKLTLQKKYVRDDERLTLEQMITNEKSVKRLPKLRMGKKTRGKMCAKCSYQNLNKHGITKPDD